MHDIRSTLKKKRSRFKKPAHRHRRLACAFDPWTIPPFPILTMERNWLRYRYISNLQIIIANKGQDKNAMKQKCEVSSMLRCMRWCCWGWIDTLRSVQWSSVGRDASPLRVSLDGWSIVVHRLMDWEAVVLLFDGWEALILFDDWEALVLFLMMDIPTITVPSFHVITRFVRTSRAFEGTFLLLHLSPMWYIHIHTYIHTYIKVYVKPNVSTYTPSWGLLKLL